MKFSFSSMFGILYFTVSLFGHQYIVSSTFKIFHYVDLKIYKMAMAIKPEDQMKNTL
jgi:hypothetical protein